MPEGPEVWILSVAINRHFQTPQTNDDFLRPIDPNCFNENEPSSTITLSYGKHLFLLNEKENWSFGLDGKCVLTDDNQLVKPNVSWIHGQQLMYDDINNEFARLGISWFNANEDALRREVTRWNSSKTRLAGILLNQCKLSGVGIAWGSEILHRANLSPNKRACDQDLSPLADVMLQMRDEIRAIYLSTLEGDFKDRTKEFVNCWFAPLYEVREPYMRVYRKGTPVKILGRTWWV